MLLTESASADRIAHAQISTWFLCDLAWGLIFDRHGDRQRHTWAASQELELEMARRRVRYDALYWKETKWRVYVSFSRLSLFQKAFKTQASQKQGVTAIDGSDGKNDPNLWS